MVFNKNNKKEISAIEDLIKAKVYVNPERFAELSKLKEDLWKEDAQLPNDNCTLLCFNPSPFVEEALRGLSGYTLQVERITEDKTDPTHKQDHKRFVKLFGGKKLEEAHIGAIIHELRTEEDQLSLLDRRVIALSLLNKLPVLVLATGCPDGLPAASAASGNTWPVFFVPHPEDMAAVVKWLAEELPRVRALAAAVEADLQQRVAHLARVNVPLHFLSRASVALVPFGVMTVNFLGILRLMANMLKCVGMRGDTSANQALGLLGAKNAALVTAIDSMGDVYQFAIFSTVLADLQLLSLAEAAEALSVLDGLMLGSVSVVTGAVSALGAYLSRPLVVRAAAEFLASLQTIYVLNPDMRREKQKRPKASKRRKGKGKENEEELRELLMVRSSGAVATRRGEAAAKRALVAEAAVATGREAYHKVPAESDGEGNEDVGDQADQLEGVEGDEATGSEGGMGSDCSDEESSEPSDEGEEAQAEVDGKGGGGKEDGSEQGDEVGEVGGSTEVRAEGEVAEGAVKALTREEKRLQAAARKQAAAEAKAAAKAAKAAARAEKKAAKVAAREQALQAKHALKEARKESHKEALQAKEQQKEQALQAKQAQKEESRRAKEQALQAKQAQKELKAAEREAMRLAKAQKKAAKSQTKAEAKAEAKGATSGTGMEREALESGAPDDLEDGAQSAEEAEGVEASGTTSQEDLVIADKRKGGEPGSGSGGSRRGSGDGQLRERKGEEGPEEVGREVRMGLDEEVCRGLLAFLSLEDEEVYAGNEAAEAGERQAGAAAAAVVGCQVGGPAEGAA